MATKRGQAAIDYWAKKTAAAKARFTLIGVIVLGSIIYAVAINVTGTG